MAHKATPETERLLKSVVDCCDAEDVAVRESQVRQWRQLKLLWGGMSQIWYSEVAHDWRIWDRYVDAEDSDQGAYDKPVNVFRAYLESIIAALSVTVPAVKCYPDDADNTLDLMTAKAGDKISQLVYRHNDVQLLWLHSLFIYCTEGMVAAYSYSKESEEYGTYEEKKYDEVEEEHEITTCANCGYTIEDKTIDSPIPGEEVPPEMGMGGPPTPIPPQAPELNPDDLLDEFMPDNEDVPLHSLLAQDLDVCPSCMAMMSPEIRREKFIIPRLVGVTNQPKSRICVEAYGGLNVKVPNYARKQSECPYLICSEELNYAIAADDYEHLKGKNPKELAKQLIHEGGSVKGGSSGYDDYDQWARLSPQYQGEWPQNVVTRKKVWLRPSAFNMLGNEKDIDELKKLYPDGAKVVLINNCFAEACNEALDDCWTLTYNPLADFVHFDPLGLLLVSIQEITNDLLSLTLQTIEHGIGMTFADPGVLNFKQYNDTEVTPGAVFPAIPKSGRAMNDAFHEVKTATLSPEVLPFGQNVQSLAQLVSGALPSLFGGQMQGSETASEYSMSRAQAQQRLQNTWKMFNMWWKNIFGKVIPAQMKEIKDDERTVQKNKDGSFFNTFIRRAELEGKIGRIELESSDAIPMSWAQKKDIIMQLLNAGNPQILEIIGSPENLPIIREAIGLTDFFVPGEDDRNEQYDEITLLMQSEPIETGDPMMPEMPSVDIDPLYNNHKIHFEIIRSWAASEAGRQARTDNPPGYKNTLLHGKMHFMQMQPQPMAGPTAGGPPPEKPNKLSMQDAPIVGEADVPTIQ